MFKKSFLSLILTLTLSMTAVLPAFATEYETDENDNSVKFIEYKDVKEEGLNNTSVFAKIGNEYKVTIPKTIVLSGVKKIAQYFVKVSGDIAGYESVSVTPDKTFKLFSENKDAVNVKIEQDKKSLDRF